mgnify:CR=1
MITSNKKELCLCYVYMLNTLKFIRQPTMVVIKYSSMNDINVMANVAVLDKKREHKLGYLKLLSNLLQHRSQRRKKEKRRENLINRQILDTAI